VTNLLDSFDQGFSHTHVAVRGIDESISRSRRPPKISKETRNRHERYPGFAFIRVQDAGERLAGVSTRRKSCHQSVPASLNDKDGTAHPVEEGQPPRYSVDPRNSAVLCAQPWLITEETMGKRVRLPLDAQCLPESKPRSKNQAARSEPSNHKQTRQRLVSSERGLGERVATQLPSPICLRFNSACP